MSTREREPMMVRTDVLVIGGGIAGFFAAIKAKETDRGLEVTLVDKGWPAASGASVFAAGVLPYWQPGDAFDSYVEEIVSENAEFLIDQDYAETVVRESYNVFQDLVEYGVEFQRDDGGNIRRIPALATKIGFCSPYKGGTSLMAKVRARARKIGVRLVERTVISDLLMSSGSCAGAAGFNVRTGEFITFTSKAIVLAAGSVFYSKSPMGSAGGSGDGPAIALRAGLPLRNMEQMWATIGPSISPATGLHVVFGSGGKLVNSRGERFMERYNPDLTEEARRFELSRAILLEWKNGNGPCYLDCTHLSEPAIRTIETSLPLLVKALNREGLNLRRDRIEYVPYGLSSLHVAGAKINGADGDVGVPGLWIVGGSGDFCGGVESTATSALSGSAAQGSLAGRAAARFAGTAMRVDVDQKRLRAIEARTFSPLHRSKGSQTSDTLFRRVLEIVLRYVNILKDESMLLEAIQEIRSLQEDLPKLTAHDPHELRKVHDVTNMIQLAEVIAKSALMRKETRRCHYRLDYPARDDINWLKWIVARQNEGEIEVWAEDVPIKRWRYRPKVERVD